MTGDGLVLSMLEAGDGRQAATVLLRTYGPSVLRYLRALLREEDAVDDAFSLFAEWAWTGISRFRGESSLRTWAFGVAWNAENPQEPALGLAGLHAAKPGLFAIGVHAHGFFQ